MQRRTKIVATLGPATSSAESIEQLIIAGVNVVRMNFSHGSPEDHKARAELVREFAQKHGRFVAILGDLQGPKIRISRFKNDKIELTAGQPFILDASLGRDEGDETKVGIDYKELVVDSRPGDILLLDDGRVELRVNGVKDQAIHCEVTIAGPLSNNKGINRKGGGLSASALTDKDKKDIHVAADINVDYLAVSFPRDAADIEYARKLMNEAGGQAGIIAKIERAEAVEDHAVLDDIVRASDGVMVARGDLGVEIGDAELIGVQKHIIDRARTFNRIAITATQMMESMINNPVPTRAEVFDVANAVLDGTDAVMLSAETATGNFPAAVVRAMADTAVGAEKHPDMRVTNYRLQRTFEKVDETIAMAVMYAANQLSDIRAIVCLTESGTTALLASRLTSTHPIYGVSRHTATCRRLALYRGVVPLYWDVTEVTGELWEAAMQLVAKQISLREGDRIAITCGDLQGEGGYTNTLKILEYRG